MMAWWDEEEKKDEEEEKWLFPFSFLIDQRALTQAPQTKLKGGGGGKMHTKNRSVRARAS